MNDLVGSRLGNYSLTRLLGKGGFANVYLGQHIHLNTWAAIKVLQTRLTGNDVMQFRDEARLIASLKHPNIVPIHDFGIEMDVPFLVMEYAANGTIRQRYPQGTPIQPSIILPYVMQVASALQFAHDHGLIHRDVKPENMLLGGNYEILLSDFGLAMIIESTRAQALSQQGMAEAAGTIYYMAPEQFQGHPGPQSDQYALGVVVYEWLCGVRPFTGSSYPGIALQHMQATPPSLKSKVPTLPQEVENVVLKALAKSPHQRFASVGAFAQAFERACKITPPLASFDQFVDSTQSAWGSSLDASLSGPAGRMLLGRTDVRIGRASDNQIVVNDGMVSGHHAVVRLDSQGHSIVDVGSTNGTFVNGQMLNRHMARPLSQGDKISIGSAVFTYEVSSASQGGTLVAQDSTIIKNPQPPLDNSKYGVPPLGSQQAVQQSQWGVPPQVAQQSQMMGQPPVQQSQMGVPPQVAQQSQMGGQQQVVLGPSQSAPSLPTEPVSMRGFSGSMPVLPPVPVPWWKRRLVWAALSIFLLVLLVAGGVFAYENSLPTPAKTLKTYCDAIQTGDSITAYNQLSPDFQKRAPQQMMRDFFLGVTSCTYDSVNLASSRATAHLSLVTPQNTRDDQVTMMYSDANGWKIDDETNLSNFVNLSEVKQTLDAYCTGLQHGDYAGVYGQFSDALQKKITQELFASFYPSVTACTYSSPTMSGTNATTTVSLTSGGQSEDDPLQLVQNAGTGWKIDDIQNLSTPTKTLQAFCNGIASHTDQGYQSAYDQISDGFKQQHNYTLDQFKARFSNFNGHGAITACQVHNVSTIGPSAGLGQIDVVTEDMSSGTFRYTLDVEQGIWKITQQY